ncbi:MAG: FKBP-type peptidyl-prolyl cis-trans isomerase N-terminal domain-containing protein, partial [Steroidobacteraceae bacterium]
MILRIRGLSFLPAATLAAVLAAGAMPVSAQTHATAHAHAHATPHSARALKDKASYSLGVLMGAQLRQLGLTTDSVAFDQVAKGLHDVVKGTVQPSPTDRQNVQAYILQSRTSLAAKNQAAARRFLAANAKRHGVTTTA